MNKKAAVVAALLVAGGVAVYFLWPRQPPPAPPAPVAESAPPTHAPDAPLPPAADSDTRIRQLFGPLSPKIAAWLQQADLLGRGVVVIDNLAEGVSPRRELGFLAPNGRFEPGQFARYDGFAEAIGSLDAQALAAALRALHPLLNAGYHKLGYPDREVNEVIARGLSRIAGAPVVEKPALKLKGAVFVYVDQTLEDLPSVEKHLLRLGPRNERLVQAKAKELLAALGR